MRNIRTTKDLFRPEYELYIGTAYAIAGGATILLSGSVVGSVGWLIGLVCFVITARWWIVSRPRIKRKLMLITNYFYFEKVSKVRERNMTDKDHVFVGRAFEWGAEHASEYHRIASMSSTLQELHLPKLFTRKHSEDTIKLGGQTFMHGLGDEKETFVKKEAFYGHTLILGLPGTGKTTLLNMLSTGTLNRGNFNLIIDPKPDADWEARMRKECAKMGMPFHFFSTSHPTKSVRIDVLRDYERVTDIPQRIIDSSNAKSSDGDDPFKKFTWKCINQVVQAMHYVSIPAQLTSISYYLRNAPIELTELCLVQFFKDLYPNPAEFENKKRQMKMREPIPGAKAGDVLGMIEYYNDPNNVSKDQRNQAVDGIVTFIMHDKTHRDKMLSSTDPLFDQLNASPLDKLLSPNLNEMMADDHTNYILNLEEMLESGGCLYVSLSSMGDSAMAGIIGKLLLSAVSSAASRRYAHEQGEGRRVSLFVDEAHACLNDKLIDLLAVGRGAKYELYLSSQTIPDFEAKTDSATAKRVLGLTSNMFALRVTDPDTKMWVSDQFSTIDVDTYSIAKQDRSGASMSIVEDMAIGHTETISKESKDLFPASAQGNLPNLQYMARMQSGQKLKGRIPIMTEDEE